MQAERTSDVVVVGAGYAGLSAALTLHEAGYEVDVLEARDRVGGRVHTEHHDGVPLDMGGMWVGAGHDRFRALLSRFDIDTFATPEDGRSAWWDSGSATLRPASPLPGPRRSAPTIAFAIARIERLAGATPPDEPWSAPKAEMWDTVTVADWLRRRVPDRSTRALLEDVLRVSFCVDMAQVSMLTLMAAAADAGGLLKLLGTEGGAQQDLIVGGADLAARRVAELLGPRLRLGTPVREIHHDAVGVTVVADTGRWAAQFAVVALPPAHVAALRWGPALPAPLRHGLERHAMGSVTKMLAVYDRPFWHDGGWSGEVIDTTGPVTTAFDATQPGGRPVLATLTCGHRSLELSQLTPDERKGHLVDALTTWFGPDAATPTHVVERSWENEEWSGGGYSAIPIPGLTTSPSRERASVGRVHFAGTETATRSNGFIDGAIGSGELAATEILDRLRAEAS